MGVRSLCSPRRIKRFFVEAMPVLEIGPGISLVQREIDDRNEENDDYLKISRRRNSPNLDTRWEREHRWRHFPFPIV